MILHKAHRIVRMGLVGCVVALAAAGMGASVVRDAAYTAAGNSFKPFWRLGATGVFRCVGAIRGGATGSGIWLGGRYVLTTAHSAVDTSTGQVHDARTYTFTLVEKGQEVSFTGVRWHIPNAYLADSDWRRGACDIAVLEIDAVPALSSVRHAVLFDDVPPLNTVVTDVGFGRRGLESTGVDEQTFGSGFTDSPVRSFGFGATLSSYTSSNYMVMSSFDAASPLALEGAASGGDSGGGTFAQVGSVWKLVGLISYSDLAPGGAMYGKQNVYGAQSGSVCVGRFYTELTAGLHGKWGPFTNKVIP